MTSQKTKFIVGLFVAGGISIVMLAVIWLGMSRFFEKGRYYVAYFDESVQGLSKDSPVKYRGVSIGRVESIEVAPDSELIQIILKIESGQSLDSSIVAQLKDVGITGSMFVELDRKKEGEPDRSPHVSFPSEFPIVASKPSEIRELLRGIDDVIKQISSLDLEGISDKLKSTLDNLNQTIVDADVKGISTKIQSSLDGAGRILNSKRWDVILTSVEEAAQSINTLVDKAGKGLDHADAAILNIGDVVVKNKESVSTAIEEFRLAMENANNLLEKGTVLVSSADDSLFHLKRQLLVSARNLEKATDNLNRLMESLADQPSQLLLGEPPVPRNVESED